VTKPIPNYLRLYTERVGGDPSTATDSRSRLDDLRRSFEQATGWALRYVPGPVPSHDFDLTCAAPVNSGVGTSPGHLRIDLGSAALAGDEPRVEFDAARDLAGSLAGLLGELIRTQHELCRREAELAVGVPLVPHSDEPRHLALRLESVLKGGAEALGCHAAALYLLDADTTVLKLRAAWGLPIERFTDPARPLDNAKADLEALLGHAVTIENSDKMRQWNMPEQYPSAVCVPVSSSTNPLGTLWLFSSELRDFNDQQTNLAEIVAGRLASDLEREVLLAEGIAGKQSEREVEAAERLQQNQLPRVSPHLEGWDLAGWTQQAHEVGGDFYDWFVRSDDTLVAAVGDSLQQGISAGITASAIRSALRSHAEYTSEPGALLARLNQTLWSGSAGDQLANLCYAWIDPHTGQLYFGTAGHVWSLLLRPGGWELLSQPTHPLGLEPDMIYTGSQRLLLPGESLVMMSAGVHEAIDQRGRPFSEQPLADQLLAYLDQPARKLVDLVRDRLEAHLAPNCRDDRTILVVKHLPQR
jgi:sigma-B regulation protein RsbU (phosphoserine phosphatase)